MLIAQAHYRISFVGGGSDLPAFFARYGGAVLSATIRQSIYVILHPSFHKNQITLKHEGFEKVPSTGDLEHKIARTILEKYGIRDGWEVVSIGDMPSQTGLGSSSTFAVGLLTALHAHFGLRKSAHEVAEEACEVEINLLGAPIGKQDQFASTYGGFNQFIFHKDGEIDRIPVKISKETVHALEQNLVLIYTGITRRAGDILEAQNASILSESSKNEAIEQMAKMSFHLKSELESGNAEAMGKYLHESWLLKRSLVSGITNSHIDNLYDRAMRAGSFGGKVLGAGGGGFFLFYCPAEKQEDLVEKLNLQASPVRFSFDPARIILNSDE